MAVPSALPTSREPSPTTKYRSRIALGGYFSVDRDPETALMGQWTSAPGVTVMPNVSSDVEGWTSVHLATGGQARAVHVRGRADSRRM